MAGVEMDGEDLRSRFQRMEEASGYGDRVFEEALPLEKRRAILEALAEKAAMGDVQVAAFLFDRLYGRPAAAPKPRAVVTETERHDFRWLDDVELEMLASLLEKCSAVGP